MQQLPSPGEAAFGGAAVVRTINAVNLEDCVRSVCDGCAVGRSLAIARQLLQACGVPSAMPGDNAKSGGEMGNGGGLFAPVD
ncbi:hypothetical protein [Pseudomonas prosekii]|uniref:hypothetical protein n=1 Tax=Pseudomonas prosekii TaxID=1148509 RepID=UPI003F754F82